MVSVKVMIEVRLRVEVRIKIKVRALHMKFVSMDTREISSGVARATTAACIR